jgi:hypothetical protein
MDGARYFNPDFEQKPKGIICHKCRQPGHKIRDCRRRVCEKCGVVDGHSTSQCKKYLEMCANCLEDGHSEATCQSRPTARHCTICNSKLHYDAMCPMIWRLYYTIRRKDTAPLEIYCYYCAGAGPYGDDCIYSRASRSGIIPSAFCEANLPRGAVVERRARRRTRD